MERQDVCREMPRGDDRNHTKKALAVCLEGERKLPRQRGLSHAPVVFSGASAASRGKAREGRPYRGKKSKTE